jgi:hypothetical protein
MQPALVCFGSWHTKIRLVSIREASATKSRQGCCCGIPDWRPDAKHLGELIGDRQSWPVFPWQGEYHLAYRSRCTAVGTAFMSAN